LADLTTIFTYFQQVGDGIVATPLFQNYGLFILLVWPLFTVSSIPIPIEIPIATLLYGKVSIIYVFLFAWAGVYSGSTLFYFLILSGKIGWHRTTVFEEIEESHLLQRYKNYFFTIGTAFFWVGDIILAYAALKHMPFSSFAWQMAVGTFLRTVIAVLIALGILSIPSLFMYLPH
jgi:membrane protein YqaA with SNARE-associated domain